MPDPSFRPDRATVGLPAGRASRVLLVLGGWTTLALLETAKEWMGWRVRGTPRGWGAVAAVNLPFWLYWAAWTPAVLFLARRFPILGADRWRGVAVHAVVSIAAAIGHGVVIAAAALVLLPDGILREPSFGAQFRSVAEGYLLLEILVYWMILGVAQAAMFRRRLVEARLGEARAEARAARSDARAADARLQALRMEVDPHFLLNALNAVSALVRQGRARAATDMLARIGDLMRVTLRYGREGSVSLRRELEFVREYLEIERVRLGERLTVVVDASADVLDATVPPLLLQPLVENAVRHGIAPVPGPARLEVRAARRGDRVRIDVLDSGPGPATGSVRGTGLRNVAARVSEEYGGGGSFELVAREGGGSRASLDLPWVPLGVSTAGRGADR